MKTIYLKELHENFRWTALALLAMGLFLAWAIKNSAAPELIDDSFFFASLSGYSAMALGFGLLQIFQDHWRGREPFIIHRPISRSNIFTGKALAGLTLYLFAGGVPLLIVIGWCYKHRYKTAPFEWSMASPALWDLLNGTTVYFAALLIGARDVRWFGSRLMPLGISFLAFVGGYVFADSFGMALLITVAALLILVPAAWASFVHRGQFESQPTPFRGTQTAIIATGITLSFMFISYNVLDYFDLLPDPSKQATWNYAVDNDGQLLRQEYKNGQLDRTTNLAGNTVADLSESDSRTRGWLWFRLSSRPRSFRVGSFHKSGSYLRRIGLYDTNRGNEEVRYSVHHNVLEVFDTLGKRWVGTIGQDGFVPAPQQARPFESSLDSIDGYVYDSKNLYRIGVQGNRLNLITRLTGDDQIQSASRFAQRPGANNSRPYLALLTAKTLRVYEADQELFSIQPPLGPPIYTGLYVDRLSNGHFTIFYPYSNQDAAASVRLIELDERGQTVRQTEAPAAPMLEFPWWSHILPILPSPFALGLFDSITAQTLPPPWAVVAMGAIALASGLAGGWQVKRYAFAPSAQVTWIVFCALMGVPGFLALLSLRTWPPRIKCPNCGRPRLVTRQNCEHCQAPRASPRMEGIEIMEPAFI